MEFHIIDDLPYVGEIITETLEMEGYTTKLFSCPAEYIAFSRSKTFLPPAAIFTDIKMPKMSGFELIDVLHSHFPNQKFVIVSATPAMNHPAMEKVSAFLHKPINLEILVETAASLASAHAALPDRAKNAEQFTLYQAYQSSLEF